MENLESIPVRAAMQGIVPRVPVFAQMHEHAMKKIGVNATKFYSTPELD